MDILHRFYKSKIIGCERDPGPDCASVNPAACGLWSCLDINLLLTRRSTVGMPPYLNNRLDCGRGNKKEVKDNTTVQNQPSLTGSRRRRTKERS